MEVPVPPSGLREVKKARTRQAISDIATRLFMERGFEAVTVAEIAAEADVSVKTVFNYFPAKEDLFFDRAAELIGGLEATIRDRPAGVTVAGALHRLLADNLVPFPGVAWRRLRDPEQYERFRAYVATEHASPALRSRRHVIADAWAAPLGAAVAAELELPADRPRAEAFAAMVLAAMALRHRTLAAALLERRGARAIERRVRAVVDEALGRIARAFADVDRPA
ncbi:MAG TPA: TetR family transcriptional regulator [Solirubrobacteraceae bacterium]|nr:TetR family transcriptional regulator [Solirubrobacteraceae bacterium]